MITSSLCSNFFFNFCFLNNNVLCSNIWDWINSPFLIPLSPNSCSSHWHFLSKLALWWLQNGDVTNLIICLHLFLYYGKEQLFFSVFIHMNSRISILFSELKYISIIFFDASISYIRPDGVPSNLFLCPICLQNLTFKACSFSEYFVTYSC